MIRIRNNKLSGKIIIPIILVVLFLIQLNLVAQLDPTFEHYNIKNGLSHNSVQSILQDEQGFLWVATEDGLNRFDGYEFKIFRPTEDTNSISGIFIWDLVQDSNGNIWIGTNNGGLNKYDPYLNKFTSYKHSNTDSFSIGSNYVRSLLVDAKDNLWVGTYGGGLNLLDKETGKFQRLIINPADPLALVDNVIGSLFQDSKGRIWIGTEGGLHLFNSIDSSFFSYTNDFKSEYSISHNQVDAIVEDTTGTLWIGTKNGLNKFDEVNNRFIRYYAQEGESNALSHNLITSMLRDKDGMIWIATDGGGITLFNPYTEHFEKIMHDVSNPNSLTINLIRDIFEDDLGIIWVATNGGGICKFNSIKKKFEHVKYEPGKLNGLNHNVIRAFSKDEYNRLWLGTIGGGINIYDPHSSSFYYILHEVNNKRSISANEIISLLCQNEKYCWAGTWQEGVNRISFRENVPEGEDPNKYISDIKQYRHDPLDSHSISSDIVQVVFQDNKGFVWFGTGSGIDIYDEEKDHFINLGTNSDDSSTISDNRVQSAIIQDRNGDIWIGTWNGLNRMKYPEYLKNNKSLTGFLPGKVVFDRFLNQEKNTNTISDNRVISLYEDRSSDNLIIWAGTYGGGLNKLEFYTDEHNVEQVKFTTFTERDGLSSDVVYGIQADDHDNLWMSTNNGISMFNTATQIFRNYNESEGVQSSQFYWGSGYKDTDGFIYFGGVNGYNVFHPDSIHNMSIPPKVLITDMQILNKSVAVGRLQDGRVMLDKAINYTDEVKLSYFDNVVSFEFAALHFLAPKMNSHAYMLQGIDKDWNYIKNRRFVTYTHLPPGEYIFKVKGANNEGEWSNSIAQIKLIVKPPFWETIIFRLLVIILFVVLVYIYYRVRMQRVKLQNRQLEIMVKRKTNDLQREIVERKKIEETLRESEQKLKDTNASKDKFFKIIAHDLRNPVNVTLGFSELLSKNYRAFDDEKKEKFINSIFESTTTINDLLDNLLQWSLSQTGKMVANPVEQNLSEILRVNLLLLEKNIDVKSIEIENKVAPDAKVYADKDMLEAVIRNILSNAIKFTPQKGKIIINTQDIVEGFVDMCISDSGIGMSESQLESLFKIGYSSSTKGTDGERGTGLGLILCHEFIEKNKGKIWAESKLEEGTSIFIRLPLILNSEI